MSGPPHYGVCAICGRSLDDLAREAVNEHVRECSGVDPNAVTDRIDATTLDRVDRGDGTRKDRKG